MKTFSFVTYLFATIGMGLLGGSYYLYQDTRGFLRTALSAQGTVVELVRSRSRDSTTYAPAVNFTTHEGKPISFTSTTSSNPPSYTEGETVEVFYQADRPESAKINGFFSLWGGALILGGIGAVFFIISASIILASRRKAQTIAELQRNGITIQAKIQSIGINNATSRKGRKPYVIHAQWQNPATSEIHVFSSDNLWFDPTEFVRSDTVNVLIDQHDPSKYHMDTSFLPKLAN
ncbi:DUF3592 domain-containing protein [Candidatus Thiothrix sp. Deng01]|uniref:DUF3592 domain-containing protein n=1 Tax=Candidatus Thiothrix phosphatis TaxID=3112415 RepID=A0ABU6CTD0_9GAMM|nr:DUF3592 domain-containing protein [Candidatus Thiothrix sp. Deng01]MEB4589851.1 DUF3592 domain-containing protein [Candidatus Thiothrix sp. Deng01]